MSEFLYRSMVPCEGWNDRTFDCGKKPTMRLGGELIPIFYLCRSCREQFLDWMSGPMWEELKKRAEER